MKMSWERRNFARFSSVAFERQSGQRDCKAGDNCFDFQDNWNFLFNIMTNELTW